MTQFVFANNVNTTLASAISNSATTLTLASSANLPASIPGGEYFALTLNDAATQQVYEIVYATAISGATLTVVRAQEGTAAHAWAVGDFAFSGPTAGQMASFNTGGTGVTSFNTRTGAVTLSSSDVDTALGYTPANQAAVVLSFNTRQENVVLNSADVDTALGYTPANDASVVHIAGTETITGAKTFSQSVIASSLQSTGGTATIGGTAAGNNAIQISYTGTLSALVSGSSVGNIASFTTSAASFPASVTCTTMNATGSDRRLKRNIRKVEPRPLHRSIPYVSFERKTDRSHGRGAIAQIVQKFEPAYVGTFKVGRATRLSLDYQSMAYEQAIWAGREVDRLTSHVAKLERALVKAMIEPRKRGFVRRLLEAIW